MSATAAAALSLALLVPASLGGTAHAASPGAARAGSPAAATDDDADPQPPDRMSTVGGKLLGSPGTQMKPKPGQDPPGLPEDLTARSWIVSDAESGEVLAAHNAHWKLPPASTLKMLFADTVLPKFPQTKTHKVKASDLEGMGEGSSLVGVKEDQTYSVRDLWRGVFLRSGNDAVHVLAAMNGGKDKTVREMNEQAAKLRAEDTNVVSPDGYDKKGQVSSAYDLTLFARSGMQKADFREYASTARAQFPGEKKEGEKRETYEIQNTNRLLTGDIGLDAYPGIAGVKNGSTSEAGATFTGVAQRGDRVLLVTTMHPDGRQGGLEVYKETAKLFDWGFKAAEKVRPVGELVAPDGAGASGKSGDREDRGKAAGQTAGADGGEEDSGGVGVAIGVTGGCLVLVAAVAYAVHRRWPIPDLSKLRRLPFGQGPAPDASGTRSGAAPVSGAGAGSTPVSGSASGSASGSDSGSASASGSVAGSGSGSAAGEPEAGPADRPGPDPATGSDRVGARDPD
ncbi:D-alanyl-D-alanine carboxypeptidase family protein [Streptomyces abyssalis]|uniref:D-alanyl-D-alanine carboxypeptidase family protein n=1 Tax=Streptomyces abyssalis TaxID=933944 RepID=UPI00085BB43C|nr:D-alanyl-D-alanine carboxypeptidase [Streptomyces abyssalis]